MNYDIEVIASFNVVSFGFHNKSYDDVIFAEWDDLIGEGCFRNSRTTNRIHTGLSDDLYSYHVDSREKLIELLKFNESKGLSVNWLKDI